MKTNIKESRDELKMNVWKRLSIWMTILFVGMIAVCLAAGDGSLCGFPYLYPYGLGYAFLGNRSDIFIGLLGYPIYILILAGFLQTKRLSTFKILCVIMILVCFLTSYGCQEMVSAVSESIGEYHSFKDGV